MEPSIKGAIKVTGGAVLAVSVVLVVVTDVVPAVRRWFKPCHGQSERCADATHLQICDGYGPPTIGRCARCTEEGGCEPIADPVAGDVCSAGCGGGGGALPEEMRCTKDGRAAMWCSGCVNVWRAQACRDDEVCQDATAMGPQCVRAR